MKTIENDSSLIFVYSDVAILSKYDNIIYDKYRFMFTDTADTRNYKKSMRFEHQLVWDFLIDSKNYRKIDVKQIIQIYYYVPNRTKIENNLNVICFIWYKSIFGESNVIRLNLPSFYIQTILNYGN